MSAQATNALFALADAAAVDPSVVTETVTDTVSNKKGGFFGPLASVFEAFLKVQLLRDLQMSIISCYLDQKWQIMV